MKRLLFFILVLTACCCTQAQQAYYDAIYLKERVDPDLDNKIILNNDVQQLLKIYYPGKSESDIDTALLNSNPFFYDLFTPRAIQGDNSGFRPQGSPLPGGFNVTAIADGLARFLIKRGKEELNIAFFQRMKKFLENNVEAKTLFPATAAFLGNIASYRYAELLQSLREAFHKDIKNLIINLNLLIDLPKYKELLKALPEIRVAIRSAKIVSGLSQADSSVHPAILIHQLAYLNEWKEMDLNLEGSWKLLDIISQSIMQRDARLTDKGVAWIRYTDFQKNILTDQLTLRLYIGLLYEKVHDIAFRVKGNTIPVQQFLRGQADNIFTISDLVENFLLLANDVDQVVKEIKEKAGSLNNDDYYNYIEKSINIIEYGFKVANAIDTAISADRYIIMARNANNLYKNIYTKNYNAGIMNGYLILEQVLAGSRQAISDKKAYFTSSLSSAVKDSFLASSARLAASKFFDNENERAKLVEKILKYGNLIASIAKSETPEEAEAAIEAAALPAGSSSIKKNAVWNISLNAYIGGYISSYTNNTDKIDGNNSKVGVTAPVGIAISKGLGHFKNGSSRGALSAYFSLIDVGGIAGYRLNNDSTALEQKVTLNQIFAPGGYLVYGIGLPFLEYIPLSVGYGWQYGSKLYYKTSAGSLAVSDQSRWRSNWFIAIDIPLANFYTKNALKKR